MADEAGAGDGSGSDARARFRSRLRERFREKPYPLFVFREGVIPAASVWTGSRLWVEAFRSAGLTAGDRVVLALPPSAAWGQVFVAAVWEGLTLALVPEARTVPEVAATMATIDARAGIAFFAGEAIYHADPYAGAASPPNALRETRFPPTPDARFLLRTSGTASNDGRWVALSDANALSVVDSHLPHLGLVEETSRVLSVLPWSHAFGLVIDLLPAIFSGAEIVRDPDGGRDIAALLSAFADGGITDMCAVPLTIRRLIETDAGRDFLRSLNGGVVGGAPVGEGITPFLRETRLRVGYGQTEASPGIALGAPGDFPAPRTLGKPLGCDTRISGEGTLQFRGANACVGEWSGTTGYTPFPSDTWRDTGDIVTQSADGTLFFTGRTDSQFKLANGRRIEAEPLENALRVAIPGLENVLVFSPDGETLTVASDIPLDRAAVANALGTMGKLLGAVRVVPTAAFAWTPKGTLKRHETLQNVAAK